MTNREHTERRPELRLHIDWTSCDGRGLCVELAPELLTPDDWGYPILRLHKSQAVPTSALACAKDAIRACPKRALRLLPID